MDFRNSSNAWFVFAFTVLLLGGRAFTAIDLTGRVVDVNGHGLGNVDVELSQAGLSTTTDEEGWYHFDASAISPIQASGFNAQITSQGVQLSLTANTSLNYHVFSIMGALVQQNDLSPAGSSYFLSGSEMLQKASAGVYFVRLNANGQQMTVRLMKSTEGAVWVSGENQRSLNVSTAKAAATVATVDTIRAKLSGYNDAELLVANLSDTAKTIEMYLADFYRLTKKLDVSYQLPNQIDILFQTFDQAREGVTDLTTADFEVLEDGSAVSPTETQMQIEKADALNYRVNTVLVLDNSTSISDDDLTTIRAAAKALVRSIGEQQYLAIYVFSEDVTLLEDFTQDTTALLAAIDNPLVTDFRYSSTNLYGAAVEAVNRISSSYDIPNEIVEGNVIIFTDGDDTQGTSTLAQALSARGTKPVYTLGLGAEIDESVLQQIGNEGYFHADDVSTVELRFREIQASIECYVNSLYYLHYKSTKRGDNNHNLRLLVKDNANTGSDAEITGSFNSRDFASGFAPEVDSIWVTGTPKMGEVLTGHYNYFDADGEPEGTSIYTWLRDGAVIDGANDTIYTLIAADTGFTIQFQVTPVALVGTPKIGVAENSAETDTITPWYAPVASNVLISGTASEGETLTGSYSYSDAEGDVESGTSFRWLRDGVEIAGETGTTYVVTADDLDKMLSFEVTPKTTTGTNLVGSVEVFNMLVSNTKFLDSRDDQIYNLVTIGTQTWMAENLNYAASGSYCYANNTANCDTYGRLYTWTTVMNGASTSSATPSGVQGVCPDGWHLPSDNEWEVLAEYVANESGLTGKSSDAWIQIGKLLKANSSLWNTNTGTDAYGFAGLPGGVRSGSSYDGVGVNGFWWSSTESSSSNAYYRILYDVNDLFYRGDDGKDNYAFSVRCLKDN